MRSMILMLLPLVALAAPGRSLDDPAVKAEMDALKLEPSIQQAQSAALEFFNIDASTVSSMRTRAQFKALLPTLDTKVRVKEVTTDVSTLDIEGFSRVDPAKEDAVSGTSFEWEIGASWSLSRLIFNPEVLDVSSVAVLQEGVLKEVTRLYYTRRRLQVDLILSPPTDPATQLSKQLRVDELTATLDAMCGNVFTRYEKRKARMRTRGKRRR